MDYQTDQIISAAKVFCIKTRFKDSQQNLYGHILIILANNREPDSILSIISDKQEIFDEAELHMNWYEYQLFIADRKWKDMSVINLSNMLTSSLGTLNTDRRLCNDLFNAASTYNYAKLDSILFGLINIVIREKNLFFESVVQEISLDDYKKATSASQNNINKVPAFKPQGPKTDILSGLPQDSIILNSKLILSPVKGKPIYDLKKSDTIMVRIQNTSSRQKAYIKLMGLHEKNGDVKPVPADVIAIQKEDGEEGVTEILAKIDDKLYAKISETEKQVKIKIYDPFTDGQRITGFFQNNIEETSYEDKIMAKEQRNTKFFITILVTFLIVLLSVIIYLLLSWTV